MSNSLKQRNYGVDLLRIISMLAVVTLHILGHGGMLGVESGVNFYVIWLLEIIALPAVNCYVLISGFTGFKGENYAPKIKNIISLWCTVVFYNVIITTLFYFFGNNVVGEKALVKSVLPVITDKYWFFTAYFVMFLVSPLLNFFVHRAGKRADVATALFVVLGMTFYPTLFKLFTGNTTDIFGLDGGYSYVWFCGLYLLGALIKKYGIHEKLSKAKLLWALLITYIVSWAVKVFVAPLWGGMNDVVDDYISPNTLFVAVLLFCLFAKISTGPKFSKFIGFLVPSVFSVYLIHDNKNIRDFFIGGRFAFVAELNPALTVAIVLGAVTGIFLVCILADKLRILIFKLLRIEKLAEKTGQGFYRLIDIVMKIKI